MPGLSNGPVAESGGSDWMPLRQEYALCVCVDFGSEISHLVPYAKFLSFLKLSHSSGI